MRRQVWTIAMCESIKEKSYAFANWLLEGLLLLAGYLVFAFIFTGAFWGL